ncbi:potassium transporter KtrA [Leifsonia sp. Leaf336]|uniref:K(+)-transporting ATPase subunit C n=1 Tax=Leifsonia sp. Leaf336 TaxID=1736341 RepID=UPI00070178B5|nr:K(+)-transporting ATPase subunit C [Leifsonia sp. Leaf336]KQR51380.1 potassium transporter KtrA [Leifsonia sp. Leaf336]
MNASARGTGRQYWVALRALLIFTVALGIVYPLVITGIGLLALPAQANGSATTSQGKVVGSSLIGQSFTDKKGNPLPQWFQSRPSAAGTGYDAGASSGSNWGPNNPDLLKAIQQRKQTIEKVDGVSAGQIPADALTASGSGLDPHISPAYALLQVDAVAKARGISADSVRKLVDSHVQQRDLGYLGEPTVNVLQLNIALAAMDPSGNK